MEYFDVYNKYGEKTEETIERGDAHRDGICHRVVHLWILNADNEVLLQQRSATKESGANLWYVSVGGHIDTGESIESTLLRETKEELGLDISHLTDSIFYLYTFMERKVEHDGRYIDHEFYDVFVLKADFDISQVTMQAEEVQAVKYVKYDDFKKAVIHQDSSLWLHGVGYRMLLVALDDFIGVDK